MHKENKEAVVKEIIEYANQEIHKSKKKHLLILSAILIGIILLSASLILVFTRIDGSILWLFFGLAAIICAICNVIQTFRYRKTKWFRFSSMVFTVFTLCSFYAQAAHWVSVEDWSALMDVLPGTSRILWFLTTASVVINSISLFEKSDQ